VSPDDELIKDSTDAVKVTLEVKTSAGYNDGEARCYYKSADDERGQYILFAETGNSNVHTQELDFLEGNYEYDIRCVDLGGNPDEAVIKFSVETDLTPPRIVRAYKDSSYLRLITNEEASCVYGTDSCNYPFSDGISMTQLNEKPRSLVTGGAGFLGSHLCEYLMAKGHTVICMDNLITGNLKNIRHLMQNENFEFIKYNVSHQIDVDGKIDYVIYNTASGNRIAEGFGILSGVIKGENEILLEGALIKAEGSELATTSVANGEYILNDIPVGTYSFIASAEGYKNSVFNNIEIISGETKEIDFELLGVED